MFSNRVLVVVGSLIISALVVVGAVRWFGQGRSRVRREERLVVAMMSGWAPFMTVNEAGEYEGFDVDVATTVAARLNKELEIVDMGSLAPTFLALAQGKVDMVLSGLDITQERRNQLTMVPYTGELVKEYSLLFWQQVPKEIARIEDLAKIPQSCVAVEPGSAQERFLDTVNGVIQKPLGAVQDMVLDVQYGKSTALLVEPLVARRIQKANTSFVALQVPLPESFQVFGMGIAIAKNNNALAAKVAAVIANLKAEGVIERLEQQWQLGGE